MLTVAGAFAGCSGDDGNGGNGDGGDQQDYEMVDAPDDVDTYLTDNDANLYEGEMGDLTGESEVAIKVGAGENGFAFEPAAAKIDTGTTVVWTWTGEGGSHNVQAADGANFESDLQTEEAATFDQTFEEAGTVTYFCQPHQSNGMRGALVIE